MPHNSTVIAKVGVIKASSVGIASSSGGFALGVLEVDPFMVILSASALVISIFAFLYDYNHTDKAVRESGMTMFTTLGMYMIFGTPALPAAYTLSLKYTNDIPASMVVGAFASWFIVAIIKAIKARMLSEIKERKV